MYPDHWFLRGQPESQPHKLLATKNINKRLLCWRGDSLGSGWGQEEGQPWGSSMDSAEWGQMGSSEKPLLSSLPPWENFSGLSCVPRGRGRTTLTLREEAKGLCAPTGICYDGAQAVMMWVTPVFA